MKYYQRKNGSNGFNNNGASVIESNGPCGKIRGNIKQVLEKYESAVYENINLKDEVKTQYLLQYLDHYNRLTQAKDKKFNHQKNNFDKNPDKNKEATKETKNFDESNDATILSEIFGQAEEKKDISSQNNIDLSTKETKVKRNRKRINKTPSERSTVNINSIPYINNDITEAIDKLDN